MSVAVRWHYRHAFLLERSHPRPQIAQVVGSAYGNRNGRPRMALCCLMLIRFAMRNWQLVLFEVASQFGRESSIVKVAPVAGGTEDY